MILSRPRSAVKARTDPDSLAFRAPADAAAAGDTHSNKADNLASLASRTGTFFLDWAGFLPAANARLDPNSLAVRACSDAAAAGMTFKMKLVILQLLQVRLILS